MTLYQEEMQRKAQHYGCLTDYDEADQLLLISHKGVHLTAVNPEGFMYYNNKELTDPESREVFSHLVDDAEAVREYVDLYESAPQMQPKDVQNYRKFSEYGDVVFAGMYSEKHGFMFCSWRQSDGGKYLAHGDYSPDYLSSKENYAVRAGLIVKDKIFTKAEAEELFKCAAFARDNCDSLTYCRVSTKQEEQLHSYETQVKHYTERINAEPGWILEGIYADKGITGTSYKKRDEFNRMIRRCKQGKIDMIIVKSIARFARNTVDCLKFVRILNDLGVVVYFEEQGIYTNQPGAEFYITIYGCIAQSESENISANVKWGKARSAKEGNVPFHYKNFLGYRKGADGKPEIDPEEAETVRFIYERFLAGDSLGGIAQKLEDMQIPSPKGKAVWSMTTIQSILSNEKYKGDAVINKTYIKDCLSKKVMVNNGERPKYYIENNHPAIIDAVTFGRVQEELARRAGKPKTKKVGTKTEQGKYSSKYAMTELLVCGECKTPYRRCTWTVKGQKKIVWRCINRLDFGKKYCHNSPTVEESILQRAVMRAIMETAQQNLGVLQTLKVHIGMALDTEPTEDNSMDLQIRIAEIDAEFKAMLSKISTETVDAFDEGKAKRLMDEKVALQQQLAAIQDGQLKREQTKTRLDDIYTILDGLKNRPMEYDEQIVRQLLECITVDSKEQITVIFVGGLKVVQPLID